MINYYKVDAGTRKFPSKRLMRTIYLYKETQDGLYLMQVSPFATDFGKVKTSNTQTKLAEIKRDFPKFKVTKIQENELNSILSENSTKSTGDFLYFLFLCLYSVLPSCITDILFPLVELED